MSYTEKIKNLILEQNTTIKELKIASHKKDMELVINRIDFIKNNNDSLIKLWNILELNELNNKKEKQIQASKQNEIMEVKVISQVKKEKEDFLIEIKEERRENEKEEVQKREQIEEIKKIEQIELIEQGEQTEQIELIEQRDQPMEREVILINRNEENPALNHDNVTKLTLFLRRTGMALPYAFITPFYKIISLYCKPSVFWFLSFLFAFVLGIFGKRISHKGWKKSIVNGLKWGAEISVSITSDRVFVSLMEKEQLKCVTSR